MATLRVYLDAFYPDIPLAALVTEYDRMSAEDRACVPTRITAKLDVARATFTKYQLSVSVNADLVSNEGVRCTEPLVKFYLMAFACATHLANIEVPKADAKGGLEFL
jgi:hypothetical protein